MGIFSSGAESSRKIRQSLAFQYLKDKKRLEGAQEYAEGLVSPFQIDPSVMQELQGAVTGGPMNYQQSPLYQRYMDVGRETMLQDMAGTGTLYSGKRMEGIRDLGQSAFSNYMGALQQLAGMGQNTASQLANIRMGTTQSINQAGQQALSDMSNIRMAQQANQTQLGLGGLEFVGGIAEAAIGAAGGGG